MTALTIPTAARAQATLLDGGSLLAWLGLETGDRLTYVTMDGERVCVEVGGSVDIGGRRYAPLDGLPWPGLATDSRIFLPLDGTLGIGVIRTPTLRPAGALDWLLPPGPARFVERLELAHPSAIPGDGWYAVAGGSGAPSALVHVWCSACSDAGTYVWMERGGGITRVEERTIVGPRRLTLVGEGCEETT